MVVPWQAVTVWVLVALAVLVVVADTILVQHGQGASLSGTLLELAQKYPILPFALGVLIGHLFWPQK